MWLEFGQIFDKCSHDSDVRAIVLSGAGDRAFTTGLDVHAASKGILGDGADAARKAATLRRHVGKFQECVGGVERCEKRWSTCYVSNYEVTNHAQL